jgi:hypothetical protein
MSPDQETASLYEPSNRKASLHEAGGSGAERDKICNPLHLCLFRLWKTNSGKAAAHDSSLRNDNFPLRHDPEPLPGLVLGGQFPVVLEDDRRELALQNTDNICTIF